MRRKVLLLFLFSIFIPALAGAELYRWVDSSGREHYVDNIAKVPPEYRDQAQNVNKPKGELNVQSRAKGGEPGSAPGSPHVDNSGRDELWWRNQAENLRKQIRLAQEDLDFYYAQRKECEESQKYIISDRKRDCAGLYEYNIKRVERNIEQFKKKLEVDLPEEARRAGAYPGWIRE